MDDRTSHEKAKLLTLLQRQRLKGEKEEKVVKSPKEHENLEKIQKRVLNSPSMLNSAEKEKIKPILKKIEEAEDIPSAMTA